MGSKGMNIMVNFGTLILLFLLGFIIASVIWWWYFTGFGLKPSLP